MKPPYLLSFDPGGSEPTWAFSLSCLREVSYNQYIYTVLETGKVPVFGDLSKPDFSKLLEFHQTLAEKWDFKNFGCNLVAERFVGRGITGKLSEYIPFALGVWSSIWQHNKYGDISLIMAAQWKRPLKNFNLLYPQMQNTWFSNWWEHYFHSYLPPEEQKKKKYGVHIQDACAIGWWAWTVQKKIWSNPMESLPDVFSK